MDRWYEREVNIPHIAGEQPRAARRRCGPTPVAYKDLVDVSERDEVLRMHVK